MRALVAVLCLVAPLGVGAWHAPADCCSAPWQVRADEASANTDAITFDASGDGIHVQMKTLHAIFWRPQDTENGQYEIAAQFTQNGPTSHPEAYGLIFGGQDLKGPNVDYVYFLIRQDGKYLVKRRQGAETHTLVGWTADPAIQPTDGKTNGENTLAVAVGASQVRFLVNGKDLTSLPRADVPTSGIVGLRANHHLDLDVRDFGVTKD
jgi:hypothetical protein